MKNRLVGTELFRADGRTDRHDEADSRFLEYFGRPSENYYRPFTGGQSRVILRCAVFTVISSTKPNALYPVKGIYLNTRMTAGTVSPKVFRKETNVT